MMKKEISEIYEIPKRGKRLKFFAWVSPPIDDEHYREFAECGYTHLYIDWTFGACPGSPERLRAVKLCEKFGVRAIFQGGHVSASGLTEDANDYAECPAFDGIASDEPITIGELEVLSGSMERFLKKYPDRTFYINLVGMAGDMWDIYSEAYKRLFLDKTSHKHVSGDAYPLLKPDAQGAVKIQAGWLPYLERLAKLAADTGSEFYFFLQTMSISGNAINVRLPSEADIRFCSYVILAHGAKGLQHFCYATPGGPPFTGEFTREDHACIDREYKKTDVYYSAKNVIAELKAFEHILLDFSWKGVMTADGKNAAEKNANFKDLEYALPSHPRLGEITAAEDTLIGCFENEKGNAAFLIVNFTDPLNKKTDAVSVTFTDADSAVAVKGGVPTAVPLKNSVYTTRLAPGEAEFIILPPSRKRLGAIKPKTAAAAPKSVLIDANGILTFANGGRSDEFRLYLNGLDAGACKSGEAVLDRLSDGWNNYAVGTADGTRGAEKRFFKVSKNGSNVSFFEDFSDFSDEFKRYPDTYNVYGIGRSRIELIQSGYPAGGSGKVVKLFTDADKNKDWSSWQILTKPVPYEEGASVVFVTWLNPCAFSLSFSCDPARPEYPRYATMDKPGSWTQIEVPMDKIVPGDTSLLRTLYLTTGAGVPFGTIAYIDKYFITRRDG
jgi:hypothetical protein